MYIVMFGKILYMIMGYLDLFSLKLIKEKDYNGLIFNEWRIVWFMGGMFMVDGVYFLMVDYNNYKLKKFKRDVYYFVMEFLFELVFCDVMVVNNEDEIIVILLYVCKIVYYCINSEGFKLLGVIIIYLVLEGVVFMGDKIVVLFGDCIKIIGEDGVEIQMILMFESFMYIVFVVVLCDN